MSGITFMLLLFVALDLALTAWFWITNNHIEDRADRIEKRLDAIEGRDSTPERKEGE